jgi:AcrR family transcriptional regulator
MQRVIECAGVSRGAALHHYPNKLEMLSAVVRQATSTCISLVDSRLGACPPGIERVTLLVDALWCFLNSTSAHALFEIEVAARGDPMVAERVFPVVYLLHERLERLFIESLGKAQPLNEEVSRSAAKLLMGSMRGVALEASSGGVDATSAAKVLWVDSLKELLLRQFHGGSRETPA